MANNPNPDRQRVYSNDHLNVVWKPGICIHSKKCWKGLIQVFNPNNRPWVNLAGATREQIIRQIDKCPSGALSYNIKNHQFEMESNPKLPNVQIEMIDNGPLKVTGEISINFPNGTIEQKSKQVFLCRCGASSNKPYCDGSHRKIEFKG